jgi:hypothetical protein
MSSPKLLGHTTSGKPVPVPGRGSPDTNNIDVFQRTKARFAGWTRADHMDAARLFDLAAEEASRTVGGDALARRYQGWSSTHWDVGGRWTSPEYEGYLARRDAGRSVAADPPRPAEIEADVREVVWRGRESQGGYRREDPVWLHGYPGVVLQTSSTPGMIDVRTSGGVATVDPEDTRSVQPRSIPSVVMLGGKAYEIFRGSERIVELRGPRGAEYILTRNVHDASAWGLIPGGQMKPRAIWYCRDDRGAFTPIASGSRS